MRFILIIIVMTFFWYYTGAQDLNESSTVSQEDKVIKATEFAIPSSPAFNMLNANTPSRIERYAGLRDFKVDWSLTNGQSGYNLSPGLAIEVMPVWMIFFDRSAASRYRRASPLARTLSTLSISAGTNASNTKNWLAWAAKINLIRQHDPLRDESFLQNLERTGKARKDSLRRLASQLHNQKYSLDKRLTDYKTRLAAIKDSIDQIVEAIQVIGQEQSEQLLQAREHYITKHWNSAYLDLAAGRLYTYIQSQKVVSRVLESKDKPGQTDTVSFVANHSLKTRKEGFGIWLSGGLGISDWGMVAGMMRFGRKASLLTDTMGSQLSLGLNFRYGTRRYNFFVEGFYDHESYPINGESTEIFRQKFLMFTLGGDWRISRNVMLSFGIRQTRDVENGTLLMQPLVNINCLMR
jgi:hypothetical protein